MKPKAASCLLPFVAAVIVWDVGVSEGAVHAHPDLPPWWLLFAVGEVCFVEAKSGTAVVQTAPRQARADCLPIGSRSVAGARMGSKDGAAGLSLPHLLPVLAWPQWTLMQAPHPSVSGKSAMVTRLRLSRSARTTPERLHRDRYTAKKKNAI